MSHATGYTFPRRRRDRPVVRRSLVDFPTPTPQPTPCRLWQGAPGGSGYGRIWDKNRQCNEHMHRWVWAKAYGPIPSGMVVRHKCDQPLCYRLDHLEIGTVADNSRDMMERGRNGGQFPPNHNATLTVADVAAIRAEWTGRYGQAAELGHRYGVHRSTILRIAKGESRMVDPQRNACAAAHIYEVQGAQAWSAW